MLESIVSFQIVKSDFLSHRMSDFKTNEYADLTGIREFEPEESNPLPGFDGASLCHSNHCCQRFAPAHEYGSKVGICSQVLSDYRNLRPSRSQPGSIPPHSTRNIK